MTHLPARAPPRPLLGGRPSSPEASEASVSALRRRAPAAGPLPAPGPLPAAPWRSAGSRQGSDWDGMQGTCLRPPAGTCFSLVSLLAAAARCALCRQQSRQWLRQAAGHAHAPACRHPFIFREPTCSNSQACCGHWSTQVTGCIRSRGPCAAQCWLASELEMASVPAGSD